MSNHFKEIESTILKLSEKERAHLASLLLHSLDDKADKKSERLWLKEIDYRNQQFEAGKIDLVTEDELRKRAKKVLDK